MLEQIAKYLPQAMRQYILNPEVETIIEGGTYDRPFGHSYERTSFPIPEDATRLEVECFGGNHSLNLVGRVNENGEIEPTNPINQRSYEILYSRPFGPVDMVSTILTQDGRLFYDTSFEEGSHAGRMASWVGVLQDTGKQPGKIDLKELFY